MTGSYPGVCESLSRSCRASTGCDGVTQDKLWTTLTLKPVPDSVDQLCHSLSRCLPILLQEVKVAADEGGVKEDVV